MSINNRVAVSACRSYGDGLEELIFGQLSEAGVTRELLEGKKIAVKPNLVMSKKPEAGATTHPAFLSAAIHALKRFGAENIVIAESPGGPYTEAALKNHYITCGIADAAEECGAALNYDLTWQPSSYASAAVCRRFNVITPIADADVILNLCKLKTHSLTKMSCAVKNFFGVIPGMQKIEMHAAYSRSEDFCGMLCDLCAMLCSEKTVISVCDGIVGMEGNGPTGGTPRTFGVVLTSLSPFALDLAAESLLGFEGTVQLVETARGRGLCVNSVSELELSGDSLDSLKIKDVILPDSTKRSWMNWLPNIFGGRLGHFLSPRPFVNTKKCVGCGECVRSCPAHTIKLVPAGNRKKASIDHSACIRCYCCQELCPVTAVEVKKNLIIRLAR